MTSKHKLNFLFSSIVAVICCLGAHTNASTNISKPPLCSKSIDSYPIDIALKAQSYAKRLLPNRVTNQIDTQNFLEHWYMEIQKKIDAVATKKNRKLESREKIDVLLDYFFGEIGFRKDDNIPNTYPRPLLIDQIIQCKEGICNSLSIIFLSLAKRLNLPVYGVELPGHFLVRLVSPQNNFNYELTQFGTIISDEKLKMDFQLLKYRSHPYLQSLTLEQSLATCLYNLGVYNFLTLKNIGKAEEAFKIALEYYPESFSINSALGETLMNSAPNEAIPYLEKAVRLFPENAETYNFLAISYQNLGKPKLAIENYEKSIKLDPTKAKVVKAYAEILFQNKNYEAIMALYNTDSFYIKDNIPSFILAVTSFNKGRVEDARRFFNEFIEDGGTLEPQYQSVFNVRKIPKDVIEKDFEAHGMESQLFIQKLLKRIQYSEEELKLFLRENPNLYRTFFVDNEELIEKL